MLMTKTTILLVAAALATLPLAAQNRTHLLNSDKLSLAVTTNDNGTAYYQYFGPKIQDSDIAGFFGVQSNYTGNTLPVFGIDSWGEKALAVRMSDGNISLDLGMTDIKRTTDSKGELIKLTFKDKAYPVTVHQYFRRYAGTDIFGTWYDITNDARKGNLDLLYFASACIPLERGDNYLSQFHGGWGSETKLAETPIPNGQSVIADKAGLRNSFGSNPGFMITANGKPEENRGAVFGGNLRWSGNYKTKIDADNHGITIYSGINDEASQISVKPGQTFTMPEFLMTWSDEGKGGVSRAFHKWGRKYGMMHGDREHDILLNSWEGVYMNVNQDVMDEMMADFAALGGELFVMDDGWFGVKYPRNRDESSLGDWKVNPKKLPLGIKGLTEAARKHGLKFGIWIEPEMANTVSELFDEHPDWILRHPKRNLEKGRGGTQVVLDLTNPKVQDYVFSITDNLLSRNPEIAYIKWDANADIMNYNSLYLPKDEQTELYVRYHEGLHNVLDRIRAKYPDVAIQLCASGGGRGNYGLLPWFDEFWASDNTDALQRIYIQWGDSHFYPAIAQASHVSASPNHQTRREVPIKFRFDVAMSGRLGMELQPSKMKEEEREFAKRAIAAYKEVRPVVQFGDQYRLVSPYDNRNMAALMYADESKRKAVVYAYRTEYLNNESLPALKLDGVDENLTYTIRDLTPLKADKKCFLDGKKVSGRILKNAGLNLNGILNRPFSSMALELTAE